MLYVSDRVEKVPPRFCGRNALKSSTESDKMKSSVRSAECITVLFRRKVGCMSCVNALGTLHQASTLRWHTES
ncbi:hypothetical protein Y032_0103g3559 [Ancylostoma ceylanicum]|uniref:Uncharacterized protein n=1 Tax=Ancylostoma ceylanicum TaxID=53326 RepID=A0A016TGY3_9BILA|nr:hypothetical protein Y032_0103g3559 [Ancylostoma ceylanicum]